MKIGYGKIGRSMPLTLEKCGNLGGDVEMVAVVKELALRHPEDVFWLLGRNTGEHPQLVGLPDNVVNPWRVWAPQLRERLNAAGLNHANLSIPEHIAVRDIFRDLTESTFVDMDAQLWWVGQHGSTNTPVPRIDDTTKLTKPHDWCTYYASFIFQGINAWRDARGPRTNEEIYLNADARNRHKMRDLKWPLNHPILTQYDFAHQLKHERYGDGSDFNWWYDGFADTDVASDGGHTTETWKSTVKNVYSRLEINGLAPGTPFGDLITWNGEFDRPYSFGMFINEARAIGVKKSRGRLEILQKWVLPLAPDWLHGTWSKESLSVIAPIAINPAPWDRYYPMLNATRCTFTTPSSGSGWATAKPWEAFAGGTVCFFHPDYDDQNNILGDAPEDLQKWLRVKTPAQLKTRIKAVNESESTFNWLITEQRAHFDRAMKEKRYLRLIEERIYG